MQEVIEFLYDKEREISAYEVLEIAEIASDVLKMRKPTSESKDIQLLNKKASENNTFDLLQLITGFDTNLYKHAEGKTLDANPERTKIVGIIRSMIEVLSKNSTVPIVEFDVIRDVISYTNMPIKLQTKFFLHIVSTNGQDANHEEKDMYLPNYQVLLNHEYKHITTKEVYDLIKEVKLHDYLTDKNPENPEAQRELFEVYHDSCMDYSAEYKSSIRLDQIFMKHPSELTEEDYNQVIKEMAFIGFKDLTYRITKLMRKSETIDTENIENVYALFSLPSSEYKPRKITVINKEEFPKKDKEKPKHSQRELNQVHYEISKLFDLDTFKPKTTLTLDEIIYILSLMFKIEMEEDVIFKFLESAVHSFYKGNPISVYYQAYDKFAAVNDPIVKEHIEMIEYILSDNNILLCDDAEYQVTKMLVASELAQITAFMYHDYNYEINKAKALIKEQEVDNNGRSN